MHVFYHWLIWDFITQGVWAEAFTPKPWSLQSDHHVKRVDEEIQSSKVVIIYRLHKMTSPIESRTSRQNKRQESWTWMALIMIYLARVDEGGGTHMGSPQGPISTSYPYPLSFNPICFKLVSFNSLRLLLHNLKQSYRFYVFFPLIPVISTT